MDERIHKHSLDKDGKCSVCGIQKQETKPSLSPEEMNQLRHDDIVRQLNEIKELQSILWTLVWVGAITLGLVATIWLKGWAIK